jgi:hypothetical protein
MFISGSTSFYDHNTSFSIFPNPASDIATLLLKKNSDVIVYNTLGKQLINRKNINGNLILNKEYIGAGLFFVNIVSGDQNIITKLVIK